MKFDTKLLRLLALYKRHGDYARLQRACGSAYTYETFRRAFLKKEANDEVYAIMYTYYTTREKDIKQLYKKIATLCLK